MVIIKIDIFIYGNLLITLTPKILFLMLSLIQHLEKPDQPSLKIEFIFKQTEGIVTEGIFILLHENAICNHTYFALVEYISTTFDVILITRNHEGIN